MHRIVTKYPSTLRIPLLMLVFSLPLAAPALGAQVGITPSVAPFAPGSIKADPGNASVTLTWVPDPGTSPAITKWQYQQKVGNNNYGAWTDICVSSSDASCPTKTSHTVTGLTNGTAYRFKLRGVNIDGDGTASTESSAATPAVFCGRTKQVRDGIVNLLNSIRTKYGGTGDETCSTMTDADLADIRGAVDANLRIDTTVYNIGQLKPGDFDGLVNLQALELSDSGLRALPAGIFDDLVNLRVLLLGGDERTNSIGPLPSGIFDKLTNLRDLNLAFNGLSELPPGLLHHNTKLETLDMRDNNFSALPADFPDWFLRVPRLWLLSLSNNKLSSIPKHFFLNMPKKATVLLDGNGLDCVPYLPFGPKFDQSMGLHTNASAYPICHAGVTLGATDLSMTKTTTKTYSIVLDQFPNPGENVYTDHRANNGTVTITPVNESPDILDVSTKPLIFSTSNWDQAQLVTVLGLKEGSGTISHTIKGGGYYNVTVSDVTATVTPLVVPGRPDKPTVGVRDQSLRLRWNDVDQGNSPITSWEYQQRVTGEAFGPWTQIPNSGADTRSYLVTGLTNGTSYSFRLRAVNSTGSGLASDQTDPAVPARDVQPSFGAQTVTDQSYTKNQAIASLTLPAATGGNGNLTYALSPDLPAGLAFDAAKRVISGTPTSATSTTEYTLTATDADGDKARLAFDITVTTVDPSDLVPSFGNKSVTDQSYTQNQAITSLTLPAATGGNGTLSYALTPDLPAGLAFNAATRTLSGTPTAAMSTTEYSLTATDADGDMARLSFDITVTMQEPVDLMPSFGNAAVADQSYTQNQTITSLTLPAATGGDGTLSYALTPDLPAGVAFSTATRTLSGTPTAATSTTAYTLTATDADGDTAQLVFNIQVIEAVATVVVDLNVEAGDESATLSWTVDRADQDVTGFQYQIREEDGSWGQWITIPQSDGNTRTYMVAGLENGRNYSFRVRAVSAQGEGKASPEPQQPVVPVRPDLMPEFGDASVADQSYVQNQAITPLTLPAATGGDGELSYALSPTQPAGLAFNAETRTLSGTPAAAMSATQYTLTATDADGDAVQLTFMIEVAPDLMPEFGDASVADQSYTQNQTITPLTLPMATGGDGELSYALSPALPAGLAFDVATLTLSGRPTTPSAVARYTLTASDVDGDEARLAFSIRVAADRMPSFGNLRISDLQLTSNRTMRAVTLPVASGGDGDLSYTLSPALPQGLAFNAATRTLDGVPTAVTAARVYTYMVTDSDAEGADSASLTFSIEVSAAEATTRVLNDVLAAKGRALLTGTTDAIGERFRAPAAQASTLGNALGNLGETLASDRAMNTVVSLLAHAGIESPHTQAPTHGVMTDLRDLSIGGAIHADSWNQVVANRSLGPETLPEFRGSSKFTLERVLGDRSFTLPVSRSADANGDGARWTLWGALGTQRFDGSSDNGTYDGGVNSLYLGADARVGQVLTGAALSLSRMDADLGSTDGSGQFETELTALHPYLRGETASGMEFWVIGGLGTGTAEHTPDDQGAITEEADLDMHMAAAGLRRQLMERGALQFSLVGGAGYMSLSADGSDAVVGDLEAAVSQGRLALEVARAGELSPYVRVGARTDGGDGETGGGLEVVAGVRYSSQRVQFEARARALAAHSASDHKEYGGMARLEIAPRANGSGLRLSLAPSWGNASPSNLMSNDAGLLGGGSGQQMMPLLAGGNPAALSLAGDLGYGFALKRGLLTLGARHQGDWLGNRNFLGFEWKSADDGAHNLWRGLGLRIGYEWTTSLRGSGPSLELTYSINL